MICKTPTEILLHDAIAAILQDLPMVECQDFHHAKKDRHEGCVCPVEKRFTLAVHHAHNLITRDKTT